VCCSEASDRMHSGAPSETKFSYDDDASPSSFKTRDVRDTDALKLSNILQRNHVKSSERHIDVAKRTPRRHARDVRYYYDDEGRRGKRQPIDRIDEPSEWRDRLRMGTPRLLIERHPIIFGDMEPGLSRDEKGLSDGWINKRQHMDRIDEPSFWRDRHVPKLKGLYPLKRRTRSVAGQNGAN